ncbi:MAG: HPr family phosphocarrier protein [Clostridiaceae bacterium]|nr:HPr family phosphocarrier protein [Clostridiaceae bacterium]
MNRIIVTLNNSTGLHARPATLVVKEASKFKSKITIKKGEKSSDSKRIMEVLALDAQKGDTLEIIADGPDETEALKALKELIENNFNE